MRPLRRTLALALILSAAMPAAAQEPLAGVLRFWYGAAKQNLLETAARMPEAGYAFRPEPGVRSFGELLGHIAQTQSAFCAQMMGVPDPRRGREGPGPPRRNETLAALEESYAFCDPAFAALAEDNLADPVGDRGHTRMDWAMLSLQHMASHYGNAVVYLRLCGIVPPTSDP
jgi:uncharacterized damage-inducible protein DinB